LKRYLSAVSFIFTITAILWGIALLGQIIPLQQFGIMPRTLVGLRGIVFAPFLHADLVHVAANTVSLAVLMWVMLTVERRDFVKITLWLMLLGGLGTWLIGRPAYHIGASTIIYGYIGYLLLLGFYRKTWSSIIVSILVFIFYGTALWGLMPHFGFVSWEGHLSGFVAGIIVVRGRYRRKRR
jgi:membrane associated rhomboid family serine protease